MKHVLIDLQTLQILMDRVETDARDSLEMEYWASIEKIHGWSRERIEEELNQLKKHPAYLKEILSDAESILDSLKVSNVKEK